MFPVGGTLRSAPRYFLLLFGFKLLHDFIILLRRSQAPINHIAGIVNSEEGNQFQGLTGLRLYHGGGRKGHGLIRHRPEAKNY